MYMFKAIISGQVCTLCFHKPEGGGGHAEAGTAVNLQLRAKLLALNRGTRIVSHAFSMGDWKPDKTEEIEHSTIYFWTVPRKANCR